MVSWRPSGSVQLASPPGAFATSYIAVSCSSSFRELFSVGMTLSLFLGQVDVPRVLQPIPCSDEAERCP